MRHQRGNPLLLAAAISCLGGCAAAALPAPAAAALPGPAAAAIAPGQPAGLSWPARLARLARTAGPAAPARPAWSPPRPVLVTSLADAGPGSLRAALHRANTRPYGRRTTIGFTVAGTITLASPLPAVRRTVTIDGPSAPGYRPGGPPVVEINCHRQAGLRFALGAGRSRLLGVSVVRASGSGVTLNASRVTLDGDYLGLDLAGRPRGNGGAGLRVSALSSGNLIGRNPSGVSGAVANVISGNAGSGIVLAGSDRNTVAANRIGTNRAGSARIGNGGQGIWITAGASGNEIGGTEFTDSATGQSNDPTGDKGTTTPVFVVPPLGNLISGNAGNGVLINARARGNALNGNFIGTTADGDGPLGNGRNGVWIDRASRNSLTGCTFADNPFVYYNVVSGNRRDGLRVTNAAKTTAQGNFFGVGADNTTTVANRLDGIRVDGASASTQVGGVIPLGNVSAGNGENGIRVTGRVHGFTTFNTFGGLLAFKGAAPNGRDGLLITATGGDNLARTNVFSGNAGNGIELAGNASGVTVDPDIAGLTTDGNAVLPNGGDGVLIGGTAHHNVIGGSLRSVIPQNTFSGNDGYGLEITGRAHGNKVFASFIGPAILGLTRLGNQAGGVLIGGRAYHNLIGDSGPLPANLISGNAGAGLTLRAGASGNAVLRNYIGLDRRGRPLPNTGPAVVNHGRHNLIRGNRTR